MQTTPFHSIPFHYNNGLSLTSSNTTNGYDDYPMDSEPIDISNSLTLDDDILDNDNNKSNDLSQTTSIHQKSSKTSISRSAFTSGVNFPLY